MWDLPGPGLEPMSPALAGGFLTTVPPGKAPVCLLKVKIHRRMQDKSKKVLEAETQTADSADLSQQWENT